MSFFFIHRKTVISVCLYLNKTNVFYNKYLSFYIISFIKTHNPFLVHRSYRLIIQWKYSIIHQSKTGIFLLSWEFKIFAKKLWKDHRKWGKMILWLNTKKIFIKSLAFWFVINFYTDSNCKNQYQPKISGIPTSQFQCLFIVDSWLMETFIICFLLSSINKSLGFFQLWIFYLVLIIYYAVKMVKYSGWTERD